MYFKVNDYNGNKYTEMFDNRVELSETSDTGLEGSGNRKARKGEIYVNGLRATYTVVILLVKMAL